MRDLSTATPAARVVAGGVALEALLLVAVAVGNVVASLRDAAEDRVGALVLAAVALVLAAGVGAVAAGVLRGQHWSRSPALVWQAIQVAVGLSGTVGPAALVAALVALAVAVAVGVFREDVIAREW